MSPIWYELAGSVFGFAFACSLLKAGYLSLKSYEVSPGGSLSGSVQQGEHERGNFSTNCLEPRSMRTVRNR